MSKTVVSGAFKGDRAILSVEFGKDCRGIGDDAFNTCSSLESINDDNKIEYIGSNAFKETKLKSVKFDNLLNIGANAFYKCSDLTDVDMSNCEVISNGAFTDCTSLKNVNIPKASKLMDSTFEKCNNLTTVNIEQCNGVGNYTFRGCSNLENIDLNNCEYIGKEAFNGCEKIDKIKLSKCMKIGKYAFTECSNLNRVYINNPDGKFCSLIDKTPFCDSSGDSDGSDENNPVINENITFYFRAETYDSYINDEYWSRYIGHMVPMVDNNQIIYHTGNRSQIPITSEKNQINSNSYSKSYGLIEFKDKVEILDIKIDKYSKPKLESIDIPSECVSVEANTFEDCINLKDIEMSITLKKIGEYAFKNCKSFKEFTIQESIDELGEGAFAGCENIEQFKGRFVTYNGQAIVYNNTLICVLPKCNENSDTEGRIFITSDIDKNITKLGKSCFHGCMNMRRIDISSNIVSIGDNAFEGCVNLCEIHFKGNNPPAIGKDVFKDVRDDFKIFVPEEKINVYLEKWENSGYEKYVYPKPKDNEIIYFTSNSDTYIKKGNAPSRIEKNYFSLKDTSLIEKIILGDGIAEIGEKTFINFSNLEYIYLSDKITVMGEKCFYGCKKLKRIHIPFGDRTAASNGIVGVGGNVVVNGSVSGSSVNIGGTVSGGSQIGVYNYIQFGDEIFNGCISLKEFGSYHKGYVSKDNRCYIDKNGTLRFFAQSGLTEYSVPNNVIKINKSVFKGCTSLTSINIDNAKTILSNAFEGCKSLTSIKLNDEIEKIYPNTFSGCSSLQSVIIENPKLKEINENAFKGCEQLETLSIPDTLESIGQSAFEGCTNFGKEISLSSSIESIGSSCFKSSGITKLTIDGNCGLTVLPNDAFSNCEDLINVDIMNSNISSIKDNVFSGCYSITEVVLPKSLKEIGDLSFVTGNTLTKIVVPVELSEPPKFTKNGITNTESNPFGDSSYTGKIRIPASIIKNYYISADFGNLSSTHWNKYKSRFEVSDFENIKLENCIEGVLCIRNNTSYIVFGHGIPGNWKNAYVTFEVYGTNGIITSQISQSTTWAFTLTQDMVGNKTIEKNVEISPDWSLGGTIDNQTPAKYIKIKEVTGENNNKIDCTNGEQIVVKYSFTAKPL